MAWSCADRVHGGVDVDELRALGVTAPVCDFSVNLNPYGPCQPLLDAMQAAPLHVYPDAQARVPRAAWAARLDTSIDNIAVGHGAADLFWAVARAFIEPDARVLIAEPTFSEFRVAAQACGARVEQLWAREQDDFRFDLTELARTGRDARVIYLCTPNNPTGHHVGAPEIAELARALPDTLLLLDQSFLSLSDHAHELTLKLPENVICVRSLTKDFCLPGLRLGVLHAARELVARIERMRPTWATSAPAQAAIAEAAGQHSFVAESYRAMRADREQLADLLRNHGLTPLPTSATYQLVRVGDATAFRRRMLAQGVSVRDGSSFGLPAYVRLAARPADERARFAAALAAL